MGKYKQKRGRGGRDNPTGLLTTGECELMEQETTHVVGKTVSTLVEKLQHAHEEEREMACTTIAGLVSQPGALTQLMKANAIRILGPLMVDPNMAVKQAALGALRNISVDGGPEVAVEMVKQDIMTPISAFFKHYGNNWTIETTSQQKLEKDEKYMSYVQAVHLLWNICEASDTAVEVFNQERLMLLLLPSLNVQQYGIELATVIGQCLLTASENNNDATMLLSQEDMLSALLDIIHTPHTNSQQLLFKTVITGLILNSVSCGSSKPELLGEIIKVLSAVLQETLLQSLQTTIDAVQQLQVPNEAEGICRDGDLEISPNKQVDDMIKSLVNVSSAQQISLEIVCNMCSLGVKDDDGEWEDVDSSGGDSVEDMMDVEENSDYQQEVNSIMTALTSHLQSHGLVSQVFSYVIDLCKFESKPLEDDPRLKKVKTCITDLKKTGLLCINNVVTSQEADVLGGADILKMLWTQLSQMSMMPKVQSDRELLEATTSAMRAVSEKLADLDTSLFGNVTKEEVDFVCSLAKQTTVSSVQTNAIRIMATIGTVLVKINPTHPLLKDIGAFLLDCACSEMQLWVVAESLDSLFDVFAQDETDSVMKEIQLVPRLKTLAPLLKTKVNQQKGHLGEHLPIISTARMNLMRFIKYKSQR